MSNNFQIMRAALLRVKEARGRDLEYVTLADIDAEVDAALAAPVRNCDRFTDEVDAQLAFLNEVWLISVTRETMLERDKFDNWTCEMRSEFARWLFAPAKGGAE